MTQIQHDEYVVNLISLRSQAQVMLLTIDTMISKMQEEDGDKMIEQITE